MRIVIAEDNYLVREGVVRLLESRDGLEVVGKPVRPAKVLHVGRFDRGEYNADELAAQALAQQFHTVHLGFDWVPAVVAAPSSPERTAQIFRCPKSLVARDGTCRSRFPRLGVLARRDHGMGPAFGDGIVTIARVAGPVGGDAGGAAPGT